MTPTTADLLINAAIGAAIVLFILILSLRP